MAEYKIKVFFARRLDGRYDETYDFRNRDEAIIFGAKQTLRKCVFSVFLLERSPISGGYIAMQIR